MNEKFDKLDALILLAEDVLIEEELAYAREVLNPELEISKRTDRRILRYIRHTQKKPGYHPVLNAMKRIAVVVLVIGTVLFASAMCIEAVREKFWNAIVEWYEDYIAVMFVDETEEDTIMDVEFEVREPSYLPEGVVKGEQIELKSSCYTTYYHNGSNVLYFEQLLAHENDIKIDNNSCIITNIKVDTYDGVFVKYLIEKQYCTIIWKDNYYYYNLIATSTTIDKNELIKMVNSIYH